MAKIAITGGHLTPAIALIEYVRSLEDAPELVFIGRLVARESDQQPSQEKFEMQERGVAFVPFSAPKLDNLSILTMPMKAVRILRAVLRAIQILRREKPDLIVSFGSYLAVPIALAGWMMNIPVITHEQTRTAGLANQFISRFAKLVAISWEESRRFFPKSKARLTGNLLRKTLQSPPKQPTWFTSTASLPMLYVTGGSQGSEVINTTICQVLNRLLRDWIVIHQCGASSNHHRYRDELMSVRSQLPRSYQERYFVREWLTESELAWVYSHTTIALSRAGANTTQELAQHRIPALLIPLPFSSHNEQDENAKVLAATGGAVIIKQHDLDPEVLMSELKKLKNRHKAARRKLESIKFPENAAEVFYNLIIPYLPKHESQSATQTYEN